MLRWISWGSQIMKPNGAKSTNLWFLCVLCFHADAGRKMDFVFHLTKDREFQNPKPFRGSFESRRYFWFLKMSCFILYSLSVDKEGRWALFTSLPAGKISEDHAAKVVATFTLLVQSTPGCGNAASHTCVMLACSACEGSHVIWCYSPLTAVGVETVPACVSRKCLNGNSRRMCTWFPGECALYTGVSQEAAEVVFSSLFPASLLYHSNPMRNT